MPGVDEGHQGRLTQQCERCEWQMLASQPSMAETLCERSSTTTLIKMLGESVERLQCVVVAASTCQQEMHAQRISFIDQQLEVLTRLERLDRTLGTSSCNDPLRMDQPFPSQFEQSPSSERDAQQSTSFAGGVNLAVNAHLPQFTSDAEPKSVSSPFYDRALTTESDRSHAKDAAREQEARASEQSCRRSREMGLFGRFVQSDYFCRFFALLVVANVAYLGVTASEHLSMAINDGVVRNTVSRVIRVAFLLMFTIELACNAYVERMYIVPKANRWWYVFDAHVILLDLVDFVVEEQQDPHAQDFPDVSILRITRLVKALRLFRVLKALKYFRGMMLIVEAIVAAVHQFTWAICLLVIIIYCFAVVFSTVIASELSPAGALSQTSDLIKWWGSLGSAFLTLFQAISGGIDWAEPYRALDGVVKLQALLIAYLCFVLYAVLNVVTAVFCHSAIEMASRHTDMVVAAQMELEEQYIGDLHKLFHRINTCGSGHLTIDDLEKCLKDPWVKAYLSHLEIEVSDAWSFFRLLDKNADYRINVREFVDGCKAIKGSATASEVHVLMKQQQRLNQELTTAVGKLRESFVSSNTVEGVATERSPCQEETRSLGRTQARL
eukprot:TRINITY_DN56060_c0_g1_i1.p1 TRINITY_DN56060_c0_g1~~TRINITY_DN56060_c0_g1_i1.p1  ORF type:complete len:610 (-),score=89.12 TRINITY_DN56060_c0_g1_i1:111-1940(-)